MESKSPTAFNSSWTRGSLGTQALDPIAVTQHAEGTSFPSPLSAAGNGPETSLKKIQEVEEERVREEGNHHSALVLLSVTSPTKRLGEVWGLFQLSPGTAHCSDECC